MDVHHNLTFRVQAIPRLNANLSIHFSVQFLFVMDVTRTRLLMCHIGYLYILLALKRRKQINNRRRHRQIKKQWSRKWLQRRNAGRGMANMVFKELKYEDPASFRNFTRMTTATFEDLLKKVEPLIIRKNTILRECISARTRLLLTLRFLATGERFTNLHYAFRISVPSISLIIPETVTAIYTVLKNEYLQVPNSVQQWKAISEKFYKLWNFPNCLGALDGKHIAFRAKKEDGSYYYNYKGFNSIILMALVDAEYNFLYVDVGCNGRVSDGGVFSSSSLCSAIDHNTLNFPDTEELPKSNRRTPYVILCDEAFRLTKRMMKPYGQRSTTAEKIFNYRLSRARRVVENAFGILANRFQILQRDINLAVEKVQDITLTCCVLHNYIKKKDGKAYITGIDVENTENVSLVEGGWRNEVFTPGLEACRVNRASRVPIEIRKEFHDYFNKEGFITWQWEAVKKFNF